MNRVFVKGDQDSRTVTITGLTEEEKAEVIVWLRDFPIPNCVGRIKRVEATRDGAVIVEFVKTSTGGMMAEVVRHCLAQNGLNQANGLATSPFLRTH